MTEQIRKASSASAVALEPNKIDDVEIELLLAGIFEYFKYDFRGYSRASVKRRLLSALAHFNMANFSALQEKVFHQAGFFLELLQFLTVPVTSFFRDAAYYRVFREQVVPHLLTYPSLKIWIAGCSTGEEVYSLAIVLNEEMLLERSIIYATDINPRSLERASKGCYLIEDVEKAEASYLSSGGKKRFGDYFRVDRSVAAINPQFKTNILFTDHSLSTDSVFSETHFVSCRNVLIYFDKVLQTRAIGLFHDSLIHGGFLGIGEKESLRFSDYVDNFERCNPTTQIYKKRLRSPLGLRTGS